MYPNTYTGLTKGTMYKLIEELKGHNSSNACCRYPIEGQTNPQYFCGEPTITNDSGWLYCRKHIIICTNPKKKT